MTNIPLGEFGVVLDKLVSWRKLAATINKFLKIFEELGIVPRSAPDLCRVGPAQFPTPNVAKCYLRRKGISGLHLPIEYLLGDPTPKSAELALAGAMNRMRHQLFAGARFALNQNRYRRSGSSLH